MFAEDSKLCRIKTTPIEQAHQNCLNCLMKCSLTWFMNFNSSKCKYMHINTNTVKPTNYNIQQEGTHTTPPLISEENN